MFKKYYILKEIENILGYIQGGPKVKSRVLKMSFHAYINTTVIPKVFAHIR